MKHHLMKEGKLFWGAILNTLWAHGESEELEMTQYGTNIERRNVRCPKMYLGEVRSFGDSEELLILNMTAHSWRALVRRGCIHPGILFSVTFPDDKCLQKTESRVQGCSSAQVVWETSEIFRWRCLARNSIYTFGTPAKEMDYMCMAEWQPRTTSNGDHGSGIHKGYKAKPAGSPQHITTNPEANYKRKNPQRKVSRKTPGDRKKVGMGRWQSWLTNGPDVK